MDKIKFHSTYKVGLKDIFQSFFYSTTFKYEIAFNLFSSENRVGFIEHIMTPSPLTGQVLPDRQIPLEMLMKRGLFSFVDPWWKRLYVHRSVKILRSVLLRLGLYFLDLTME